MREELKETSALFVTTRKLLELTQVQMAKKLKMSQGNLAHIEAGNNNPPGNVTLKVVKMKKRFEALVA